MTVGRGRLRVVLDTGPIVAWLRADDPDHAASVEAISRRGTAGRRLATIREVVGEAYTLIRRRSSTNARPALEVLRWAATADLLSTGPSDHDRARAILERHQDLWLSYVDALLLAVAERHGVEEIMTLDGELSAIRLARPVQVTLL